VRERFRAKRKMRWLWAALLAGCLVVAPEGALAACAAQEVQGLLDGGAVFPKFAVLGRAEWELSNATLVMLRVVDLEELRAQGIGYVAELAARYSGAVLVVPSSLSPTVDDVSKSVLAGVSTRERLLCSLSSTVLEEGNTFFDATVGECWVAGVAWRHRSVFVVGVCTFELTRVRPSLSKLDPLVGRGRNGPGVR
jgi:hypothetical protein